MPLNNWGLPRGWENFHHLWIAEIQRWLRLRLPPGYRAYVGASPMLSVGGPSARPDVGVWPAPDPPATVLLSTSEDAPDEEVAVALLEQEVGVYVEREGRLVSALELISPRNKDRPASRNASASRYVGYLKEGVHLLLVDVLPRPHGFSFADAIGAELGTPSVPCPAPLAISYRVGAPAPEEGRSLAIWRRPLTIGAALPTLPLALSAAASVPVDLEKTYMLAAENAYLV